MAAAPAPGPLEALMGGGGNSFRNETASNARASGSSDLNGTFGAGWSVATSGSRAGEAASFNPQTLMIVAAAAVLGLAIWRRR